MEDRYLNERQEAVLKGIHDRQTMAEISEENEIPIGSVFNITKNLEQKGLIVAPEKKNKALGRTVSEAGMSYMVNNGIIPIEVWSGFGS